MCMYVFILVESTHKFSYSIKRTQVLLRIAQRSNNTYFRCVPPQWYITTCIGCQCDCNLLRHPWDSALVNCFVVVNHSTHVIGGGHCNGEAQVRVATSH